MDLPPFVVFLAGLVIIVFGAEMLLRSARHLAELLRISPIVIGLTVVSLGTSMPELAIGVTAARQDAGALAIGNIAGTNLVNLLLILGLSAAIRPLPVRAHVVSLDLPAMTVAALALIFMSWDGHLSRAEGAVLLVAAVAYTAMLVRHGRRERQEAQSANADRDEPAAAQEKGKGRFATPVWRGLLLLAGMALAVLGAELLVSGATDMARAFGVSDAFIGLTIVAIGTSAPELVTTLLGTLRNDRDVAIGNLIGSSTYNILAILGLTLVLAPQGIDVTRDVLWIDLPLAAAVALVCHPVFRSGRMVSRGEGAAFVGAYLAYLAAVVIFRA